MVTIEKKAGYVIWTVNLSGVKKETYILPEDVEGILLGDGAVEDNLISGSKFDFKAKKYKHANALELVLSSTQPIELKWGIFDIPYKDYQAKLEAKCGISGTLSLKVFKTKPACKALGKNVSVNDINNVVFNELKMKIEEIFSEIINEETFGRPDLSGAKKTRLIDGIKANVYDYLSTFGLDLSSVTLNRLVTDDEYEAKRRDFDERKENDRKTKDDLKKIEEIKDVLGSKDEPVVTPTKKVVICPRCGKELNPGDSWCSACGMRLR